jgi:hypothetical protein
MNKDREYKIKKICEHITNINYLDYYEYFSIVQCNICRGPRVKKTENIQHEKDCVYLFALNDLKNNYPEDFI